ncbi:HAD family hydrolase [Acinetobacter cumulans]|jgi:HAD superfamily hydrolase (TIGR01509 family)|uniref:HAD family hydrolase n=1 Tax=Acinetobacter cumulans TaxID=2136182 RepID=A0A498CXI5_9GAMM|nr:MULTISPECIES: HAD-IA family hydrolase [Acinetobacter]NWK75401.1 HAD-IA family hydrolase [Acinetobacter sp. SwsAc6]QCO22018.1 HAD-IA family hydrolase [Acinetobacter cumulans]RKG45797.1 HAD family hydrolase [Acinetobacter cumulans]RKG47437.1 HAD family hydrolase [Acinetobacter cumulans]RLL31871.1 HAD family hydrolase [Acinetobacter cumulans]
MFKFHGKNIFAAIFDMDGTMFDTERLRFQTLKQASQELHGEAFSDAYLMACLGLSAKSAEELAHQEYGESIPYADIRQRADQLELEYVRTNGVPIKLGLVQVLERLRKSGLRMAVATSSRRAIAEEYLINAGVYKFFDVLVCGDEVQQGKPHPEIFLKAAEQLNVEANASLMFEDSANGIRSARHANGITILLKDIKTPNAEMMRNADFYYDDMYAFFDDLDQYVDHLLMPELQTAFPQTINLLSVGIHGFGAIGGGYLAQVFSHWDGYTRPKRIYATTRNPLYQSAVNAFGAYSIRYGEMSYDERIDNIQVIDAGNLEQMQEMYTESTMVAVCLPESALAQEAKTIAQGLMARHVAFEQQELPLTFLIILNKIGAKALFMQLVHRALLDITDAEIANKIMCQHYFCDTVVNRMVSKLSDQNLYRQLKIKHGIFQQQQVDAEDDAQQHWDDATQLTLEQEQQATTYIDHLRRNLQPSHALQNMDLILFHAELNMPLYVENNSPLLRKMRQMILVDDIQDIQRIKNRLWNGVHAMTAWYGSVLGYETIGLAMADERVSLFCQSLLKEVTAGLNSSMPNYHHDLAELAQAFLRSCQNAFKDPCARVARDPLRKLSAQERVLGSLQTNLEYGLPTSALEQGVVLGAMYAVQQLQYSQEDVRLFLQKQFALIEADPKLVQQSFHAIDSVLQNQLAQHDF